NDTGIADISFSYGPAAGWKPIAGDWNGASETLLAAEGVTLATANTIQATQESLQPIIAQAISNWANLGITTSALEKLQNVHFVVTDLPGSRLGIADGDTIYIDRDAAGEGWFIDSTPDENEEFAVSGTTGSLQAVDSRIVDRYDLLTVVSHELGHVLGLSDLDASLDSLMGVTLQEGIRKLPDGAIIDAVFAESE
ncbi:MAG: hypothetical protein ACWGMZ_07540, partial [Thermoguttaceae bacterium]